MIERIKRYIGWKRRGVVVWTPSNVYWSAELGDGVSVGRFSEIGPNTVVGDMTRIGMGVFISEGTKIGCNCFLGPKVCIAHDLHMQIPPFFEGHKEKWSYVEIGDHVRIGASAVILPGVQVGDGAVIGMGCVVVKDIGADEVWVGNPGRRIR